jgi:hypothetical protein
MSKSSRTRAALRASLLPPVNPAARRRQFLYFLQQVPLGHLMTRYEIEGGTGLYGYNLDPELLTAEEEGVISLESDCWRKIDYFEY